MTVPWCECGLKRGSSSKRRGFAHIGNQVWVCNSCMKPTRLFWENRLLRNRYEAELDEIISRILNGQENEDGLDKGRAEIACMFIAMILTPNNPNPVLARNESLKRIRAKS